MGKESKEIGEQGEDLAIRYLEKQGYRMIERNFHSQQGEIDIIAENGEFLVFVEVKNYSARSFGSAIGAVRKSKRESIVHAAQTYIYKEKIKDMNCRFDVIAINRRFDGSLDIELIKNAFQIN
ncbi:MAG: YraN family protein [Candidatus Saganbacteria bacterium]|nr:YraN family protein [Candidatus Saganbacteria bacterium]